MRSESSMAKPPGADVSRSIKGDGPCRWRYEVTPAALGACAVGPQSSSETRRPFDPSARSLLLLLPPPPCSEALFARPALCCFCSAPCAPPAGKAGRSAGGALCAVLLLESGSVGVTARPCSSSLPRGELQTLALPSLACSPLARRDPPPCSFYYSFPAGSS